jgi:hypothetical protein
MMFLAQKHYPTPVHFRSEAAGPGVSLKVARVPKALKLHKTMIYLAHPEACQLSVDLVLAICAKIGILSDWNMRNNSVVPAFVRSCDIQRKDALFTSESIVP